MTRARPARQKGATKVNQRLNPLKRDTGSNLVDVGRIAVHAVRRRLRPATPKPIQCSRWGGHEEGLRRTRGDAAGEELGADPDERHMVNVGTTPGAALPAAPPGRRRAGPLSADARGWGGGSVGAPG